MVNKMNNILNDLYNKYSDIKYGWYDKDNNLHEKLSKDFYDKFEFQTIDHIKEHKHGICWELVELFRSELEKNNITSKTYFFCSNTKEKYCHTIIVVEDKNYFYLIEGSLKDNKGLYKFSCLEELFNYIYDRFHVLVTNPNIQINKENIDIYEYKKPKTKMTCLEFYTHCFNSKKIQKIS